MQMELTQNPLGIAAKEFVEKNTTEFLSYFMNNQDLLSNEDFKKLGEFCLW